MICTNREAFLKCELTTNLEEFGLDEFMAHSPSFRNSDYCVNDEDDADYGFLTIRLTAGVGEWDAENGFSDHGFDMYEAIVRDLEKEYRRRLYKFVKGYKKLVASL